MAIVMIRSATIFVITLFILIPASMYGQSSESSVKTGIKGGINFATFSDSDANYDSYAGFLAGGFARFDVSASPLSIQPEILYTRTGAKLGDSEVRIDYLKVPVLFKVSLAPGGTTQPYLYAGPYAAMRLLAEQRGGGGLFGGVSNIEDETESMDYGGSVGGSLDIEAGASIFTIDARYSFGFADVFRDDSAKHRVVSLTVGISLPG